MLSKTLQASLPTSHIDTCETKLGMEIDILLNWCPEGLRHWAKEKKCKFKRYVLYVLMKPDFFGIKNFDGSPLHRDCKTMVASRKAINRLRAIWVRIRRWIVFAALLSTSALRASNSAIWPALKKILVLPICKINLKEKKRREKKPSNYPWPKCVLGSTNFDYLNVRVEYISIAILSEKNI